MARIPSVLTERNSGNVYDSMDLGFGLRWGAEAGWESSDPRIASANIEAVVTSVVRDLQTEKFPVLFRHSFRGEKKSKVDFRLEKSRANFSILLSLMSKSYSLISQGQTATKRDIYYEDVPLYGSQQRFDLALTDLCNIVKVDRKLLNIHATAKGMISGNLRWKGPNDEDIQCSTTRCTLIPSDLDGHHGFETDARFILIVEKDAIYQKLIAEGVFRTLGSFLLVTGKGYPDFGTRRLLNLLVHALHLEVFALVDGDPYGIDIASTYKWGSQDQPDYVLPNLIWLGMLPSELSTLTINNECLMDMNENDLKKLDSLQKRLANHRECTWLSEIKILKTRGKKAELEALTTSSPGFLTEVYLKSKIRNYLNNSRA